MSDKLTYFLMTRMSKEDGLKLKKMAEESNCKVAEYVRDKLFDKNKCIIKKGEKHVS